MRAGPSTLKTTLGALAATLITLGATLPLATTATAAAASAPAPTTWTPSAASYGEAELSDQPVTMSDGTVLRADVFYPTVNGTTTPASGPFPVLLQQTPYGKAFVGSPSTLDAFVNRGYIVVVSDVRGTGDSGGDFDLFAPAQATDGATLTRWAAALAHSDGQVGLFGESYMGINQFMTVGASGTNSPIKAMFPIISGNDIYANTVTMGGLPDVEFSAAYEALLSGLNLTNPVLQPLVEAAENDNPALLAAGLARLTPVEAAHATTLTSFLNLLVNIESGTGTSAYDSSYWQSMAPASYLSDVVADHIPAFLVGGWNDLFQAGEPLNYVGLQNLYDGRPQKAAMLPHQPVTPRYQLMMGPWEHVTAGTGVNLTSMELEWFDTWLKGDNTPLKHSATPLYLNELNSNNTWVDAAQWPIAGATPTAYYFHGGRTGTAALSDNDGSLTTSAPTAASGSDTVAFLGVSSPCDEQTDQWAAGLLDFGLPLLNTCDQNDQTLGDGPGSLTYTTAPFTAPKVLSGPIDATLFTTSTTTDTDLSATVELISPTGQSLPLTSGALDGDQRALDPAQTWTGSNGLPLLPVHPLTAHSLQPITPGQVTEQDIQVFPTTAYIPSGWRLRVTISTGDTPHLVPTLAQLPHLLGGIYQIQHNSSGASFINVPLAPPADFFVPCGALCTAAGP